MKPSLSPRPTAEPALGMLELADVCSGYLAADQLLKAAEVELLS